MLKQCKKALRAFVDANQFCPTVWGFLVNPFWLCRRALYQKLRAHAPQLIGSVLDFGCGTGPYRHLLTGAIRYAGLEYDSPENRLHKRADIFYDGENIPLEEASVDAILSTQTLEHVPNPEHIVAEWARILRPGGKVLLTVPFMWPEHEMPYDFQRYTTNGIKRLLENAGFEIIVQECLLADCRAPAQLFQAWLYDILRFGARRLYFQLLLTVFLFAPLSLFATALAAITPANTNTYTDNMIFAERVAP
jgi:SAM-dependent methyltransferase